ncbi:MAG: subclass B3 metallo-beta-lactamase [Bacteroidetes bacterium]|nr:subclass B3 metallo-beta-lactamase [Bacteroidota bacterium]
MMINGKCFSVLIITVMIMRFSITSNGQAPAKLPIANPEWTKPYQPFRIAGNLYYVGTYDLASYLITTSKGHILINTGLAESVPMLRENVEALGFKFPDIKILLATHAHFDHVAGLAAIKKITRAKIIINENDAQLLEDGGKSDYIFGEKGSTFEPVKVDVRLHEQDTVRLGDMQIVVLHHPGHTKGASSFLLDVKDEHRSYRVLIANMPSILSQTKLSGMPGYPDIAKDYARTLDTLGKIQFDIWLASHASQFDLHHKYKPGDSYRPEVFIDRKGYDAAIDDLQKDYTKRLTEK